MSTNPNPAPDHPALEAMRTICLALPDSEERETWGHPTFRVNDKIFASYGLGAVGPNIGFKLEKEHARLLIASDERCRRAAYVGQHGWVSMDVGGDVDWEEVRDFVLESFDLIAPKRTLKKLAAMEAGERSDGEGGSGEQGA